jgi:UDP-glucose 4-epimerase
VKILVLGGGGFMGSFLCDRLLEDGHAIRIFERPRVQPYRTFAAAERVEWMPGDFQSGADVAAAVAGCDAIYHFVSTTLPEGSNEDPIFDVESNLVPTLRLLERARAGAVKKVVFVSSGGTVYGTPLEVPIAEHHPNTPLVSYGIIKLTIEKYLHLYHSLHGLEYVVLRVANAFGERQRADTGQGAIAVFVDRALTRQPIEIWGDGSVTRDYIYVHDVIDAFVRALDHRGRHRIFNVGSGRGSTLNEILTAIEASVGWKVERRYLPARPFDVPTSVLDVRRAAEDLGWKPKVSLQEGIVRTIAWARSGGTTPR